MPGVTLGLALVNVVLEKTKQVVANETAMKDLRAECEELTKSVNEVQFKCSCYKIQLFYLCIFYQFLPQVLSAIKMQSEPLEDSDLMECIGVLMTAIRHFLPLVFATRSEAGWLRSMWMANEQEKSVIEAKDEVLMLLKISSTD